MVKEVEVIKEVENTEKIDRMAEHISFLEDRPQNPSYLPLFYLLFPETAAVRFT